MAKGFSLKSFRNHDATPRPAKAATNGPAHNAIASISEIELFAADAEREGERLDAVAEALDRLAAARKRNALRVIK